MFWNTAYDCTKQVPHLQSETIFSPGFHLSRGSRETVVDGGKNLVAFFSNSWLCISGCPHNLTHFYNIFEFSVVNF